MTGDKGTPSAIHAGMGVINPEAHAANIPGALRAIARRADADEPATEPDFPTLAAQYASMLGIDAPEPVLTGGVAHSSRHYHGAMKVSGRAMGHMS